MIDAAGRYVLPGGIDVHTHLEMPFGGTFSADTFETGTRAAAWGGTTTIIDFAVQAKGARCCRRWTMAREGRRQLRDRLRLPHDRVRRQRASLKEMDTCSATGVNSFKLFMAYPGVFYSTDGEILQAMQQAARDRRD